jgi:hypothetical protein
MNKLLGILTCVGLLAESGMAVSGQGVIVNEIMYHPASENLRESYVELYNPGTTAANLSGWQFTKGLQFAFPTNTTLAPGGYLVVAADGAVFAATHPGVANYISGWTPPMGSHLVLEDASGQIISEVHYYNDGDWATRVLTNNGFAAYGHYGWEWLAPHDGLGNSLELINPALPNTHAQNWGSSSEINGTPGRANSIASTNTAPIITEVQHQPAIPRSTDSVTISARIVDEHADGLAVTLNWRLDGGASFNTAAMHDDGAHGDGLAGDGIFGALLPAQADGVVVEFFLQATDKENNTRTYPVYGLTTASSRTANLLYQVDNGTYTGAQPVYRVIMREDERAELYQMGRKFPDGDSDAQMNATWITSDNVMSGGATTQLRYLCGARNRGHGTRLSNPNNYHVNIPGDRAWKGLTGINLNSQFSHSQVLGSAVFRSLGIPMAESRGVQVRINGTNLMSLSGLPDNNSFGSYAANEQYNKDFVQRTFPLDPDGNSYRGIRQAALSDPEYGDKVADLTWHGANFAQSIYTNTYFKQNNTLQNDWSDLIDLLAVFNSANGHASSNYAADVEKRINVDEWMKYMAVNTLLDNDETCLANGEPDDFALYRGTIDTRFLALPYDMDTVMGRGLTPFPPRHSIFRMNALSVMDRFMKTPEFAPHYYRWLKTLADTAFSSTQMDPLLDQLYRSWLPQNKIDNMKAFNAAQINWVLSQIPLSLTVSNTLTVQSGYPHTTTASVSLTGGANAIDTRGVMVNGTAAAWVAWQGTWSISNVALTPGINRVLVQSLDANGVELARAYADIWYDDGSVQTAGGTIAANAIWTAAGGPYNITSSLTVNSGVTLTIEAGTTVYLASGVNIVIANGGRIVAEGTDTMPIRFTTVPGSSTSWGGLTIDGAVGSPETRLAYVHFEGNGTTCIEVAGGTLYLDHATFGTTTHQYVALDGSSFMLSHCVFPTTTAAFELLHGTGGIKTGGRGIVRECYFGSTTGYNDIMDFTGGNRDAGQPIVQYYNNVFAGASDDILDLDGTDAWIEGNIFLHNHRNGSPDSSSAISGGSDSGHTSEITAIGNIFYDCDNAATAKEGNFFTLINNTIVHVTKTGGEDFDSGVVNVRDTTPGLTTFGKGYYLEGNIIQDAEQLVRNYDPAQTTVTFNDNILPTSWTGPGTNNQVIAPLLKYIPQLSETYFTNWQDAQIMRDWFSLLPGSPARGTGPNGRDMGGVIALGASVSGEPVGTNNLQTATLHVGVNRIGNGIPTAGFPQGSGYVAYKWRLNGGDWSAETAIAMPIALANLTNGTYSVEVIGKRDSSWYQNDPALGEEAIITSSGAWVVDSSYTPPVAPKIRINEILAKNSTTLNHAGTTPDLVELYNYGATAVDLSGMGLSGNAGQPYSYTFPAGATLAPGAFLVFYADSDLTTSGLHLGFALKQTGDSLYLHDTASCGGGLLDAITFGLQVADLSLGRAVDGTWVLCRPTFGSENIAAAMDDPHGLKINEWLADEMFLANNDFVELYNPGGNPVALEGCYLSNAEGDPNLNPFAPNSYIGAGGYQSFVADATPSQGANHLNFKLNPNVGIILLSDALLNPIDTITYGPQSTDVSQGRSPSGSDVIVSFPQPTAGGPNPAGNGGATSVTNITSKVVKLLDITNTWQYDNSGTDRGAAWYQTAFVDSAWSSGTGLFGYETTPAEYPYAFNTTIPAPDQANGHNTVYYRTHFQWDGSLTNITLVSTNYVDDGAVYYLNGVRSGSIRMSGTVTYSTLAGTQPNEGTPEILILTNAPVVGDNVIAVEVHQVNASSSDDVFGMQLAAVQSTTNIITTTTTGVPVVLNEVLANNESFTNGMGTTPDWIELFNTSTNEINLADLSLSDDPNDPRKFVFAPETRVPANGYLIVYCDNSQPASTNNTGFHLSATGASVYLFNSVTNGGGLIDAISFGLQTPDFSIGRIPDGTGTWALNAPTPAAMNSAAGLGGAANLSVNEWMADPASGSDWFELYNSGAQPVALGGVFFTDNLTAKTLSPVPPLSFIGTGAHGYVKFVADGDQNAGADHVNFKLKKSGETIGLFSSAETLITAISFGPQLTGISQGRFPDGSANIVSFSSTVTPAAGNYLSLTDVVVNEVLTHTDPPFEDAIEFYNSSASPVDIGGWFLSNSPEEPKKYQIASGTSIPAHGFVVLYEYQFNSTNGSGTPFTLNSAHGDSVCLSQALPDGSLTGYRAMAAFGAAANGVSFGRYTNSIGQVDFVPLSATTFGVDHPQTIEEFRMGTGALNASPLIGPVVISEIQFYPTPFSDGEDNTLDEFIELQNISTAGVDLFDPAAPTNTWVIKGGAGFTFPQNVSLPAGGRLLLVNIDPADPIALQAFRDRYPVSGAVPVYGPYNGHLGNSSDKIGLYKSDPAQVAPHPDAGFVPYVLVEELQYSALAPWPAGANGTGFSLQRQTLAAYGNDPANWFTAVATPGQPNGSAPADANNDGLPDAWQIQYFGSISDPNAAPGADPDGDGMTNLQEYAAGTSPLDPTSVLSLDIVRGSSLTLTFSAMAQKSYTIEFNDSLTPGNWQRLADVPAMAAPASRLIQIIDPAPVTDRYYRVRSPQLP